MPSIKQAIDANFPSFTGKETPEQQIRSIYDYLYQLRQGLRYTIGRIEMGSYSSKTQTGIDKKVTLQIDDLNGRIALLTERLDAILNIVEIAADGSVTLGTQDKSLRLVGNVSVNGVDWLATEEVNGQEGEAE